ncbi:MAG: hypothetical protein LBO04_00270, partial [Spirochaetaceae bacterium]|nr:hypothetical protein [Spirochaetaceae bacterium]
SREAAERLNGTYKETNKTFAEQLTVWEKIKTAFATAFTANHPILTDIRDIYKEQAKIIAGARIMKKVNDDINNSEAAYKQKLAEIRTAQAGGFMDEREANIERLEANKALTEELIKQLEIAKKTAKDADEIGRIEARLSLLKQERDVLTNITAIDRGNKDLLDAEEAYAAQLSKIAHMETAMSGNEKQTAAARKQADADRLAANETYLRQLVDIYNRMMASNSIDQKSLDIIWEKIKAQSELLKEQRSDAEKNDGNQQIDKARAAAQRQYNEAVRMAGLERERGLITEKEHEEAILQALHQKENAMKAIVAQYNLSVGRTVDEAKALEDQVLTGRGVLKQLDEKEKREKVIKEITDDLLDTDMKLQLAQDYRNADAEQEIDYKVALIALERARAREELKNRLKTVKATKDETETILEAFDERTKAMKDAENAAGNADKGIQDFFQSDKWNAGMQMATAAVETFTSIANEITQAQVRVIEEQIAEIDKMLDAELERIEEMRQAALEEAGFAEATTQESLQSKLDAAIEAGDQILAYEYQRRLEEKAINDRFDAQAKAAEEKAAKEKAELEYKAAKAEWDMSLIQAGTNLAMALLNAVTQGASWPVAMGGPVVGIPLFTSLAAAAGGVQIGFIANNPPKPPSFEEGGIVPGTSFSGDNVLARLNSGERVLTMDNQEFLLAAAGGGGGREVVTLVVPVYLDTEKIAEVVVDDINSARHMIDERGIRRG